MSMLKLLATENYITVNKSIIKKLGLDCAVFIGELCSKALYYQNHNMLTKDGFFYCVVEDMQNSTGLSTYRQKQAIEILEKLNIIEVSWRGMPRTRYYKINENALVNLLYTDEACIVDTTEADENFNVRDEKFNIRHQNFNVRSEKFNANNNINNNNINNNISNTKVLEKETSNFSNTSMFSKKEDINIYTSGQDCIQSSDVSEQSSKNSEIIFSIRDAIKPTSKSPKAIKECIQGLHTNSYEKELKQALFKWYYETVVGTCSVKSLQERIYKLAEMCNNNICLMISSINNSYINGWKSFYPCNKQKASQNIQAQVKCEQYNPEVDGVYRDENGHITVY